MIYFVKPGDMLWQIALKLNTTVQAILRFNTICNPNLIIVGDLIYLPDSDNDTPAGRTPFYVIKRGDTLRCLAGVFEMNLQDLIYMNRDRIQNPDLILPGNELLVLPFFHVGYYPPTLVYNMKSAINLYGCEGLLTTTDARVTFEGNYVLAWEGLGKDGIPYLLELLNDPCYSLRYYAAKSLGKIASNQADVLAALGKASGDSNAVVAEMAKNALKRINLVQTYGKRIHVITENVNLLSEPGKEAGLIRTLPSGTEFIGLEWRIPGLNFSYFDYVKILSTGETGFIFRFIQATTYYMI